MSYAEVGIASNLAATSVVGVSGAQIYLLGFYVNSTSSGVIHLRHASATGADLAGDITPAIGFHRFPANCPIGLHMTLVSGSINVSFLLGGTMAEVGTPFNKTSTGDVALASTPSALIGFYVNSTSSGTLILKNGGSGGTALCGTITPAIGFHRFPASCPSGLHATIANTLDVTFFLQQGNS